jgi:hypothetical protein
LAKDKGGGFMAYYLPYANDRMYWTNIDSDCGFFFTAQLNGCAIFITNEADNPKIYHCNYIPVSEDMSSGARAKQPALSRSIGRAHLGPRALNR